MTQWPNVFGEISVSARAGAFQDVYLSPSFGAGFSTLAFALPGCCGVDGPVPSTTLDKASSLRVTPDDVNQHIFIR
jgi:hypothetical protein